MDGTARMSARPFALDLPLEFFGLPQVVRIVSQFFRWTVYRLINDEKRDVIAKHRRLNLSAFTFFEEDAGSDIEEFWDLRAIKFKQFVANTLKAACQFVGNRSTVTEEIKKALELNIQTPAVKQWALTKNLVDLSVIVDDWLNVSELEPYDLHITKMEAWPEGLWVYFRDVVSNYGLKLVRRRVSSRCGTKHRKTNKKDSSSLLFNKYDAPLIMQ